MIANKEVFMATIGGKEVELAVKRPDAATYRGAQVMYNKTFSELLQAGALLRPKLAEYMKEQNLWDDKKQSQYEELLKTINDGEKKLSHGGIKLSEARQISLDMRVARARLRKLLSERNQLDSNTAEGQAENSRFNCLVAKCTVYNDKGNKVFSDMDDYLNHADEPYAYEAASKLAAMMYGMDNDFENNLPENQFLKKFKFIDTKLRLINKDGKLVDSEGRLIDEDGRYIDENGKYIDIEGNPVTKDGDYAFEAQPFLDDDGNPVPMDEPAATQS